MEIRKRLYQNRGVGFGRGYGHQVGVRTTATGKEEARLALPGKLEHVHSPLKAGCEDGDRVLHTLTWTG